MKRFYVFVIVAVFPILFACQHKTDTKDIARNVNYEQKMLKPITLSNSQKVSDCDQYNIARKTHTISETITNNIIASEYLLCSLSNTNAIEPIEAAQVAKQLMSARVRQFPLSIAQLFGRKTTLLTAGFTQQKDKLLWSAPQHNVVVQVKAKDMGLHNRYLIWVSDVISDGNYYSYYPAWVEVSPDTHTFTVLAVFAVYPSGY